MDYDQPLPMDVALLARIRNIVPNSKSRVGTPLPEALATVLEVDRRLSGDGTQSRECTSSNDDLYTLATRLNHALDGGPNVTLPFGSLLIGISPGSVDIDGERLVLDAGRTGLFSLETTLRDAHGRNLDLLRDEIERLTRKLACRRIGLPKGVRRSRGEVVHLLQFPPFEEGGNVVLQRPVDGTWAARFCAATPKEITEFAKDIVLDMRALWSKRVCIAKQVRRLLQDAQKLASDSAIPATVHAITVELHVQRELTENAFFVEFLALDEAMRPGILIRFLAQIGDLSREFDFLSVVTLDRAKQQAELNIAGAHGWIDDLSLAVANILPGGAASVLAVLATEPETVVKIWAGTRPLFATFYWRDGCIQTELYVAEQLCFANDRFDFLNFCVPETALASMPGLPLSSFVELPFKCAIKIIEAKFVGRNRIRVDVENERQLINLDSGQVWRACPSATEVQNRA